MRQLVCTLLLSFSLRLFVYAQGAGEEAVNSPAYVSLLRDATRSFSQRDFGQALALVDKAEITFKPTAMSLNIRGAIAIEQKKFEEGRDKCTAALNLEPEFFPAKFNLAEIPFVQGKYAEARNLFEILLAKYPKSDLVRFRVYMTWLLEKNDEQAKAILEEVPFLSDTPVYYYCKAAWEFAHGNEKAGKEWVDRGNWVFPRGKNENFANVFFDLGWLERPGAEPRQSSEAPNKAGATTKPNEKADTVNPQK